MEFKVRVCHAVLKRDLRSLSDMSPFVELSINGIKKMSSVKQGGGKKPRWNQNMEINAGKETELVLTVFDDDVLESAAIGRAWIDLGRFPELNKKEDYNCELFYDKKVVGKIQLQITKISDKNSSVMKSNQFQFTEEKQKNEEGANLFMNALFQNIVKENTKNSSINQIGGQSRQNQFHNNSQQNQYSQVSGPYGSPHPQGYYPNQNQFNPLSSPPPPQSQFNGPQMQQISPPLASQVYPQGNNYTNLPPHQPSQYIPVQPSIPQQNYAMNQPQQLYPTNKQPIIKINSSSNKVPPNRRITTKQDGGCLSCLGIN